MTQSFPKPLIIRIAIASLVFCLAGTHLNAYAENSEPNIEPIGSGHHSVSVKEVYEMYFDIYLAVANRAEVPEQIHLDWLDGDATILGFTMPAHQKTKTFFISCSSLAYDNSVLMGSRELIAITTENHKSFLPKFIPNSAILTDIQSGDKLALSDGFFNDSEGIALDEEQQNLLLSSAGCRISIQVMFVLDSDFEIYTSVNLFEKENDSAIPNGSDNIDEFRECAESSTSSEALSVKQGDLIIIHLRIINTGIRSPLRINCTIPDGFELVHGTEMFLRWQPYYERWEAESHGINEQLTEFDRITDTGAEIYPFLQGDELELSFHIRATLTSAEIDRENVIVVWTTDNEGDINRVEVPLHITKDDTMFVLESWFNSVISQAVTQIIVILTFVVTLVAFIRGRRRNRRIDQRGK
jgi:hypothetical protein